MEKIYIYDRQDFIEWKARCNKTRGYGEKQGYSTRLKNIIKKYGL